MDVDLCLCVSCIIWYYAFVMRVCAFVHVWTFTHVTELNLGDRPHTLRSGVRRAASLITAHHRKLSRWPPSNTSMATTATDMHTNKKGQTLTPLSFTLSFSVSYSLTLTHTPPWLKSITKQQTALPSFVGQDGCDFLNANTFWWQIRSERWWIKRCNLLERDLTCWACKTAVTAR